MKAWREEVEKMIKEIVSEGWTEKEALCWLGFHKEADELYVEEITQEARKMYDERYS